VERVHAEKEMKLQDSQKWANSDDRPGHSRAFQEDTFLTSFSRYPDFRPMATFFSPGTLSGTATDGFSGYPSDAEIPALQGCWLSLG
jgi:hypothetical protein